MNAGPAFSTRALAALLLVFTLAWFSTLDYRSLIKPDEGRYAEIAREMALSGDWVTPRLNGIKYFEKPPLQYWASAAAFSAFGPDEWTARLWSALTGFAGVLLAFYAGRRLFGATAGVLGAMVLGTSLWYWIIGHINTLDMGLSFFLQLALCAFLLAQREPRAAPAERHWMLLAWASMALAVLSKGLVGLVLPAATLVAYCAVQRTLEPLKRMHFGAGLLVFLAVAAPWFVAVSLANPEFPRFFFIHEHFERFLTTGHGRAEPFWYFVPVLAVGLLPWSTLAVHASIAAWRAPYDGSLNIRRFLLLWAAIVFLFFSASGSKLPSYILPLFAALALLAGDWLVNASPRALRWHIVAAGLVALVAVALVLYRTGGGVDGDTPEAMLARYGRWLAVAWGVFAAGALLALWHNRSGRRLAALATVGAAATFTAALTLQGHEALGRSNSADYIAQRIKPALPSGVPFYSVGMYEQTLPFYIGRTVTLVEYLDEFSFGLQQEPHLSIPTVEEFTRRWKADAQAFAIFSRDGWKLIQNWHLPMEIVEQDARRVIVKKPRISPP